MSVFVRAAEIKVGDFIEVKFKKPIEVISTERSPENPGWITITTVGDSGETNEALYSTELMVLIKNRSPFDFGFDFEV